MKVSLVMIVVGMPQISMVVSKLAWSDLDDLGLPQDLGNPCAENVVNQQ